MMSKPNNEALKKYMDDAAQSLRTLEAKGVTVPDDAFKMTENSRLMQSYRKMGMSAAEWADMATTLYAFAVGEPAQSGNA